MAKFGQFAGKWSWFSFGLGDVLAGVSVAFIAVPQSLAYAELASMPAYTGLCAVAFAALAASFFVSSPYVQAGPVATTSLLTFGVLSHVATPGTPDYVAAAGLLALLVGVTRVAMGLMSLGLLAYLLSQPVLLGFITAASVLIFASQIPTVLGVAGTGSGVLQGAVIALTHISAWHGADIALALGTIAVIVFSRRLHPLFPGILVAVSGGIGYSVLSGYDGAVVGSIPQGFPSLHWQFPLVQVRDLLIGGVVIALVGFAEAASIARTYATLERQRWSSNQEFISQGVANIAAGLFGGFPVGASFTRSSVSHLAGAKTRWSGAFTGVTVLTFLPFTWVFASLPRAVLGAIIIASTLNLLRFAELWRLRQYSQSQAYIAWLTFGLTLLLSPRIDLAVLLGIGMAAAHHLRREQRVLCYSWLEGTTLHFKPHGVLWFGSTASVETTFIELLASHPETTMIKFHLGGLGRIDLTAAIMLQHFMGDARKAGLTIELIDVPPMAQSWVKRVWSEVSPS
jgi:SulP family sulfate permease